jgi:Flp pilus assembly protein TadG
MARHAAQQNTLARTTARIAVAVGVVAAGAAAASPAFAVTAPDVDALRTRPASLGDVDPQAGLQALTGTVGYVTGPVTALKPNPLAGTGVDPLDNGVGTQLADFKPVSSQALTGPVAEAESVGGIPVLGQATGLVH